MPIYEYQCPHCGKTFEEWLKTSGSSADASMCPCPSCGTASPRILSSTSFLLKGGGWFVNHETPQSADASDTSGGAADASANTPPNSADTSDTKSGGQAAAPKSAPAASPAASDSGAGAN